MPNKFNNITITKIMDNNNHVLVQCGKKNKSINSELPLEFTSDGQNLEDYRICGNTGGVGDRCNLFNKDNADITTAFPDPSTGQLKIEQSYGDSPKSVIIAVAPNTTYTIQIGKLPLVFTRSAEYTSYPQVGDAGTLLSTTATLESNTSYGVSFTTSATAAYIVWYFSWNATESELQSKLDSMMLSKGNVLKNYKTYDEYQIPVVINGNTISFQIDEPLQFNQSISLLDTNINIPTINGINTLTIATDVKPQNLMIKGNVEYIDSGESIIYTISYYSQDGQTLIRTEKVLKYGNAMDLQNEPTKESTEQYNYTFVGWNMSANQTTATSGVLNNITSDKTVYAAFSETVRTYTVYFYNYDNTLLQTVQNVPYGGSATYTEATPTKVGTSTKEYVFTGWSPSPDSISGDISCVAQYYELTQTITDTWDEIITNAENNTYSTKYSIGDTKCLDLGIEGKVLMEIVAFNSDILASDSTKKAAITWISKQLLDNTHRMNPAIDNNTQGTGAIGGWEYSEMRGYLNSTIKPLIPSNIRSAIKEVTKYSKIYDTSGNAVNNVSTDDEVWIPSAFEMNVTGVESLGASYSNKFTGSASRVKKSVDETIKRYWLRSAHDVNAFKIIGSDGVNYYDYARVDYGIALGFCIGTAPDYITDSWATISARSAAGTAQNYYSVGDCKAVELNGTMGTETFDNETIYTYILGFNHNSTIEGNGITFGGFKTAAKNGIDIALCDSHLDSINTTGQKWFNVNHYPGGNAHGHNFGGWKGSDIRYDILGSTNVAPSEYGTTPTTANVGYDATSTCATTPITNTLMSCLPSDLRAVMKPIMKYTDNVGNKSNTEANVTVSIDYLPLLSEYEVVGTRTKANTYEQNKQAQYAYYTNGNSKIKKSNNDTNSSVSWTFRSPNFNGTNDFCRVKTDGTVDTQATGTSIGIAPIFLV